MREEMGAMHCDVLIAVLRGGTLCWSILIYKKGAVKCFFLGENITDTYKDLINELQYKSDAHIWCVFSFTCVSFHGPFHWVPRVTLHSSLMICHQSRTVKELLTCAIVLNSPDEWMPFSRWSPVIAQLSVTLMSFSLLGFFNSTRVLCWWCPKRQQVWELQHVKYLSGSIYEARSKGLKNIIIHSLSCRGMLSKSNELSAAMWKVRTWWFFIFTSPFSSTNEEFMPCEQLNISIQMWRDRFATHYQQGYVKNRGWAMQTQFVTDVPHFRANHFSSQDNEEAPPQPHPQIHTNTHTHTLTHIHFV